MSDKVPRCEVCAMKVDMHAVPKYEKEGFMWKQGGTVKSWKQRWFILYGKHLAYYEKDDGPALGKLVAKGCIHIHNVKCEPTKHSKHPPPHAPFFLHANERSFLLVAPSVAERNNWMAALKRVNDRPPAIFCAPCQRLVDLSRCAAPKKKGDVLNTNSGKMNYLVLAQGHLAYYSSREDVGQRMALNLVHLTEDQCFVAQKNDKQFEIKLKTAGDTIKFESAETTMWVHSINETILADHDELLAGADATPPAAAAGANGHDSSSDDGFDDHRRRRPSRDRRERDRRRATRDRRDHRERGPSSGGGGSGGGGGGGGNSGGGSGATAGDEFAPVIIAFMESRGGSASTSDIMDHFKAKVGKDQSTAFSVSLSRVSKFDKVAKVWKLKGSTEQ